MSAKQQPKKQEDIFQVRGQIREYVRNVCKSYKCTIFSHSTTSSSQEVISVNPDTMEIGEQIKWEIDLAIDSYNIQDLACFRYRDFGKTGNFEIRFKEHADMLPPVKIVFPRHMGEEDIVSIRVKRSMIPTCLSLYVDYENNHHLTLLDKRIVMSRGGMSHVLQVVADNLRINPFALMLPSNNEELQPGPYRFPLNTTIKLVIRPRFLTERLYFHKNDYGFTSSYNTVTRCCNNVRSRFKGVWNPY